MSTVPGLVKAAKEAMAAKDWPNLVKHCYQALEIHSSEEGSLEGKKKESRKQSVYTLHLLLGLGHSNMGNFGESESHYIEAGKLDLTQKDPWTGVYQLYHEKHPDPKSRSAEQNEALADAVQKLMALIPKGVKRWVLLAAEHAELKSSSSEPGEVRALWQNVLDGLAKDHKSVDSDLKESLSLRAWGYLARALQAETDAERIDQVTMRTNRQLEKYRKQKEDEKVERARKGLEGDLKQTAETLKEAASQIQKEEDDIRRRVANKYEQTLLSRTELDDMYRKLLPKADDPFYYKNLIRRIETRCRLASNQSDAESLRAEAIHECRQMLDKFPESNYAMEMLISLTADVEVRSYDAPLFQKLIECEPENWVGWAALGVLQAFSTQPHQDQLRLLFMAEKSLLNLPLFASIDPPAEAPAPSALSVLYCLAWCVLARAGVKRGHYNYARKCVRHVAHHVTILRIWYPHDPRVERLWREAQLTLATAYAGDGTDGRLLDKGVAILEKVSASPEEPLHVILRAFQALAECALLRVPRDYESADRFCQEVLARVPSSAWAMSLRGWMRLEKEPENPAALQEAESHLKAAIDAEPNEPDHYLRLGKIYWHMGGEHKSSQEFAYSSFLKAAQIAPSMSQPFAFLGHYFTEVCGDEAKAKRCYEKALSLEPANKDAGISLCDVYAANHQHELAIAVCKRAIQSDSRARWAWILCGRYQNASQEYAQAVVAFQNALRVDPKDPWCWEELSECYLNMGKHAAALKSLSQAASLEPSPIIRYSLAAVQLYLGMRREAAEILEDLSSVPDEDVFAPAIKLLGDTLFTEAREYLRTGGYITCECLLDRCVQIGTRCLDILGRPVKEYDASRPTPPPVSPVCVYKLIGDAYSTFAHLPDITRKLSMLKLGDAAYANGIDADPSSATLFYDRGVNNYWQFLVLHSQQRESEEANALRQRAVDCFKKAIILSPTNEVYWDSLGVVVERPSLRQHCFIKALQINPNYAPAWSDLGLMYMQYGHMHLARAAFERAHSIDPEDSSLWLGQGMFNQSIQTDSTAKIAKDAYQRSLELFPSLTARIGVCYTSYITRELEQASFSLRKYIEQDESNSAAFNLYALACELQGKNEEAVSALLSSQRLLESESEGCEEERSKLKEHQHMVRINCARMLVSLGRFSEAIETYENLLANGDNATNPRINYLLALALAAKGELDRSEKQYKLSLEVSAADLARFEGTDLSAEDRKEYEDKVALRRNIRISLAQLYVAKNDQTSAERTLRECMTEHCDGMKSTFVSLSIFPLLVAVALRFRDLQGARTALSDFKSSHFTFMEMSETYTSNDACLVEYYHLQSCFFLLEGNPQMAKRALAKAIHLDPTEGASWSKLGQLVISFFPGASRSVITGLQRPLCPVTVDAVVYEKNVQLRCASLLNEGLARTLTQTSTGKTATGPEKTNTQNASNEANLVHRKVDEDEQKSIGRREGVNITVTVRQGAVSAACRLVHINPTSSQSWLQLGLSTQSLALATNSLSDITKAIRALQEAVKLASPESEDSWIAKLSLVDCHLLYADAATDAEKESRLNIVESLIADLKSFEGLASADIRVGIKRVAACMALARGDSQSALAAYKQAVAVNPEKSLLWEEMACIYHGVEKPTAGQLAAGEMCLKSAIEFTVHSTSLSAAQKQTQEARVQLRLARFYYFCKRYVPALDAANRAVHLYSELGVSSAAAYFIQGVINRKSRNWKEATAAFEAALACPGALDGRALDWSPDESGPSALVLLNQAQILIREKALEEAENTLYKVQSLFPTMQAIDAQLASIEKKREKIKAAA